MPTLFLIALLLWASAVTGRSVRNGSEWSESLRAGVVALFAVLCTWVIALVIVFVVVASSIHLG